MSFCSKGKAREGKAREDLNQVERVQDRSSSKYRFHMFDK
jgi:hypothetical protein